MTISMFRSVLLTDNKAKQQSTYTHTHTWLKLLNIYRTLQVTKYTHVLKKASLTATKSAFPTLSISHLSGLVTSTPQSRVAVVASSVHFSLWPCNEEVGGGKSMGGRGRRVAKTLCKCTLSSFSSRPTLLFALLLLWWMLARRWRRRRRRRRRRRATATTTTDGFVLPGKEGGIECGLRAGSERASEAVSPFGRRDEK